LFKDTIFGSGRDIIAEFPWDRHPTWLSRVLELAMASPGSNQVPPVIFEHRQDFGDLHRLLKFAYHQADSEANGPQSGPYRRGLPQGQLCGPSAYVQGRRLHQTDS
jgi:hypothetical protein